MVLLFTPGWEDQARGEKDGERKEENTEREAHGRREQRASEGRERGERECMRE